MCGEKEYKKNKIRIQIDINVLDGDSARISQRLYIIRKKVCCCFGNSFHKLFLLYAFQHEYCIEVEVASFHTFSINIFKYNQVQSPIFI